MEWHQQRKPVIGICLGTQLLAVAAGGTVDR
ncbi:gamma-glutamyl-gamma-aminobutyrate hydrolase family protein [Synechococcus sp. AH-551-N17]|nr:gamma-glutamyl-gamma-aminobutyrate hydrolase family protein [Synechococcus sp. AH-551-N17]